MIANGEKKEAYREITSHWRDRILEFEISNYGIPLERFVGFKNYDYIVFTSGYARMRIECLGLFIGLPKLEWCDYEITECFVIKLGKIVYLKN
jgi:hypothetical protein